jgi:hypothetical protein
MRGRDNILVRMRCKACGALNVGNEKDGKDCAGLPGVTYKVCNSCGFAQPTLRRRTYTGYTGGTE